MSTREASPRQPSPSGGYGAATAVVSVQRTDRLERDVGGQPASLRPLAIWSASTRLLAPLVGVLALALAVAGCGGGDKTDGVASLGGGKATATTSPGGSSDPRQGALAYGRCMRQRGIDMPDPKIDAAGRVAQQLPPGVDPDTPRFKAANEACKQYAPDGGQPPKLTPQQQQQMVAFARCMRQHGMNIPDPKPDGGIQVDGAKGVGPDDPKFQAAEQACQQYLPEGDGGRVDSGPQGPGGSR
jgi:hypothetical protein